MEHFEKLKVIMVTPGNERIMRLNIFRTLTVMSLVSLCAPTGMIELIVVVTKVVSYVVCVIQFMKSRSFHEITFQPVTHYDDNNFAAKTEIV